MTTGTRSGLPIAVVVASTVLGPALGGCRIMAYDSWREGVADAQRLAVAMAEKCALNGLAYGVLSPQVEMTFVGDSEAMITAAAGASVWLSWVVNLLIAEC